MLSNKVEHVDLNEFNEGAFRTLGERLFQMLELLQYISSLFAWLANGH